MPRIYKRRGSPYWQVAYFDHQGNHQRASSGTTVHAEAVKIQAELGRLWTLRKAGIITPQQAGLSASESQPLAMHVADFLRHKRLDGKAPTTVRGYKDRLEWISMATRAERLGDLTLSACTGALAQLEAAGLSARTRNSHRQAVRCFLNWCVDLDLLERNPLRRLPVADQARDRRRERRPLTAAELRRLLEHADSRGRGLFYRLAFFAGLRRGDIKRLRWADVRLDRRCIVIAGGKARRVDVVPLHPDLLRVLKRATRSATGELVIEHPPTNQTRTRDFKAAKIKLIDEHGLHADLHSSRMTLHHLLIDAGVDPHTRKDILRHSTYQITGDNYARTNDARFDAGLRAGRDAMERLSKPSHGKTHKTRTAKKRRS